VTTLPGPAHGPFRPEEDTIPDTIDQIEDIELVREFGGLDGILAATDAELETVEGVGEIRAKDIREGLRRLQEINLVDRYLQT
jgi:ERCC4-type nuclease